MTQKIAVPGFPGYSVTSSGRVFSCKQRKERELGQSVNKWGYSVIRLYVNGRAKSILVHRIVASVFCEGRTRERLEVNHKDGVKSNVNAENLEWVTPKENVRHSIVTGLNKHIGKKKITDEDASEIYKRRCEDASMSYPRLAKIYGVHEATIKRAMRRLRQPAL